MLAEFAKYFPDLLWALVNLNIRSDCLLISALANGSEALLRVAIGITQYVGSLVALQSVLLLDQFCVYHLCPQDVCKLAFNACLVVKNLSLVVDEFG